MTEAILKQAKELDHGCLAFIDDYNSYAKYPYQYAIEADRPDLIDLLLREYKDDEAYHETRYDNIGVPWNDIILYTAARTGKIEEVVKSLIKKEPSQINHASLYNERETPLFAAIKAYLTMMM